MGFIALDADIADQTQLQNGKTKLRIQYPGKVLDQLVMELWVSLIDIPLWFVIRILVHCLL